MRTGHLIRHEDESGVSGTGEVAEVVEFDNGKAALAWYGETSSIGIYDSAEDLIEIHGHEGKTEIQWN